MDPCCTCCTCCNKDYGKITLKEVLERAKSGDLILIDQNRCLDTWKFCTRSNFNHVGMVLVEPGSKWGRSYRKCIVEALSPFVRSFPLREALTMMLDSNTTNRVFYRPLLGPKDSIDPGRRKLERLLQELPGRQFNSNICGVITSCCLQDSHWCMPTEPLATSTVTPLKDSGAKYGSSSDSKDEFADLPERLFCSELVAMAWQQAGWLSNVKPSYRYLPKDFSDSSNACARHFLSSECTMGQMLQIVFEKETKKCEGTKPYPSSSTTTAAAAAAATNHKKHTPTNKGGEAKRRAPEAFEKVRTRSHSSETRHSQEIGSRTQAEAGGYPEVVAWQPAPTSGGGIN